MIHYINGSLWNCWRWNAFKIGVNIVMNYLHMQVCSGVQNENEIWHREG